MVTHSTSSGQVTRAERLRTQDEMRRHRATLSTQDSGLGTSKRPLHPGMTRRESGFTASELDRLAGGVCRDVLDPAGRCERPARWAACALALMVLLLLIARAMGGL